MIFIPLSIDPHSSICCATMETSMVHTNEALLLGCDIDGTLIAGYAENDTVKAEANTALQALTVCVAYRRNSRRLPVYFGTLTGRTRKSREELESENHTLGFTRSYTDFAADAMGTAIAIRKGRYEDLTALDSWPDVENWNPRKIREVLSSTADLGTITLQEDDAQSTHKLSLYVKTELGHNEHVDRASRYLDEWGLTAHVVLSGTDEVKFLDLVPKQANGKPVDKGAALLRSANFLAERDGLDNPPRMIIAGDSPNDIGGFHAAIENGGYAVVPANADREFRQWAEDTFGERVYIARQPFAAGVQEGFKHYTQPQ
jgi:hydroxymethylpyrimidine pyrophosphatase-like HAD family hydrolase